MLTELLLEAKLLKELGCNRNSKKCWQAPQWPQKPDSSEPGSTLWFWSLGLHVASIPTYHPWAPGTYLCLLRFGCVMSPLGAPQAHHFAFLHSCLSISKWAEWHVLMSAGGMMRSYLESACPEELMKLQQSLMWEPRNLWIQQWW